MSKRNLGKDILTFRFLEGSMNEDLLFCLIRLGTFGFIMSLVLLTNLRRIKTCRGVGFEEWRARFCGEEADAL
jgi:hypothetical protein